MRFPVSAAGSCLVALVVAACTFDPLAGWEPPQLGTVTLGEVIGIDTGLAPDVGPPPPDPLLLDGIDPDRGDPAGDEPVVVHGRGFVDGARVYFGDAPGVFPQVQEGERIFVRTPPGAPGLVDVRVVLPDGREAVLSRTFLYGRPIRVTAVDPPEGPSDGGTPIVVRGAGFVEGTAVLLGGRRLVEERLVDDTTIIGVTPGGPAGATDLIVSSTFGAARVKGGFRYVDDVRLDGTSPGAGPAAGGTRVVLSGRGLARDTAVLFGDVPAAVVEWSTDGTRLVVTSPPGSVGTVDVTVAVAGRGGARLVGGFTWLAADAATGPLAIHGVQPREGGAAGGDEVVIVVTGRAPDATPEVRFGTAAAVVLATSATELRVRTPADSPGFVDVVVSAGGVRATLEDGFRYRAGPALTDVAPTSGPPGGGTRVVLRGAGFASGVRVRFGALYATTVDVQADDTLACDVPPGSPGASDVHVETDEGTATLADAFTYTSGRTELYAVAPDRGAMAGGTYVELYGAALPLTPLVRFGNRIARDVQRLSPTRIVAYAPGASAPGSVDVAVLGPLGTAILPRAFAYFDPLGSGPGTWGPPIDGAVNVTVLESQTNVAVPNAFVMLDDAPDTPYQGWTDLNGQVTVSGPGLVGPRTVTAAALGYSAASVVSVDAENVIFVLYPDNPPSNPPPTGEPLPPGALEGEVEGIGKYVPLPIAGCEGKAGTDGPLCLPCETDEECQAEGGIVYPDLRCIDLGADGLRCTSGCGMGCPTGYACGLRDGATRCLPTLGTPDAHCEVTRRSPFWSAESAAGDVGGDGRYHVDSRLGEVAVLCFGGYTDWETGEFTPTQLGVKRHVFAESATTVGEQDVVLDIPLTRSITFRLDPGRPGAREPTESSVGVYLDLGSDGVHALGENLRADADGYVTLDRLPAAFSGALYDAGLTVFAGRYAGSGATITPYTETYAERLSEEEIERPQILAEAEGTWERGPLVLPQHPHAVWSDPAALPGEGDRLLVGEKGALARSRPGGTWSVQPPLGHGTLRDVDGVDRAHLVVVGDGGAIYRYDGVAWSALASPTDRDLRAVWAAGPERFVAVGDHRIVEYDEGVFTVYKVAADLRGVSGRHWGEVWAVGREGALLLRSAGGWERMASPTATDLHAVWLSTTSRAGFVAGADGLVLFLNDGAWERAEIEPAPSADLFDVYGRGPTDVTVVGEGGTVLHFDGFRWTAAATSSPELSLRGVHAAPGGAWLAVGVPVVLVGPLLPVLHFTQPPLDGLWDAQAFAWTVDDGAPAGAVMITLTNATGGTRWRIVAPGHVTAFRIPNLVDAVGFSPLAPGTVYVRTQTAYWPAFDIDNLRSSLTTLTDWISWTYDFYATEW